MKPKEIAKRLIALLLALIMAALCMACSGDGSGSDGNSETGGKETKAPVSDTTKTPGGETTKAPDGETSDKPAESTGSDVPDEPVVEEKKIRVEECESTGEVGFDKIILPRLSYFTGSEAPVFPFAHNGEGYINDKGEIVIKDIWEDTCVFSEDKAFVKDSSGWHVIDTSGNILFTVEDDKFFGNIYFIDGVAQRCISVYDQNAGTYDTHMMTLTDNFDYITFDFFFDDRQLVMANAPYYDGAPFHLDSAFPAYVFDSGIYWDDDLITAFNEAGELVYSGLQSNGCYYVGDKYILTTDKNIIDISTGEVFIKCDYEKCGTLSDGVIPVCSYDKWGLIDTEGNELIKPQYDYLSSFSHGLGFARDLDGNGFLINKTGEIVATLPEEILTKYYQPEVYPFTDSGIALVKNDDGMGYIVTEKGEVLFSGYDKLFRYVSATHFYYSFELYKIIVE